MTVCNVFKKKIIFLSPSVFYLFTFFGDWHTGGKRQKSGSMATVSSAYRVWLNFFLKSNQMARQFGILIPPFDI